MQPIMQPTRHETDELQPELASLGARFIALVIDTIIVGALGSVLFFGASEPGGIVGFIIGAAYQWFFLTQFEGQTPGKMLLKIRVVKADGTPFNDWEPVVRYFGYLINSAVVMLGWLWAAIDRYNQGWHDKIVRTYVIKAE